RRKKIARKRRRDAKRPRRTVAGLPQLSNASRNPRRPIRTTRCAKSGSISDDGVWAQYRIGVAGCQRRRQRPPIECDVRSARRGPKPPPDRHPGEGRDLALSSFRTGEIPAFAGMTKMADAVKLPYQGLRDTLAGVQQFRNTADTNVSAAHFRD